MMLGSELEGLASVDPGLKTVEIHLCDIAVEPFDTTITSVEG